MNWSRTWPIALTLALCGPGLTPHAAAQTPDRHPMAARPGGPRLTALAGRWTVTGVIVEEAEVQALVKNDPSYMGAVLDIAPQRLSWQPHKGGELSDVCDQPQLVEDGVIACGKGAFGPPGSKLWIDRQGLKIEWYDGGTLVLRRKY